MSNVAKDIIIPNESGIFRSVFLYVGQGDATLLAIPDGDEYKYMLIDSNIDKENEGIDLVKMLKDLLGDSELDVFLNTHPHEDHLAGIKDIYEEIGIKEIWHSGHKPGKKHDDAYKLMKEVIDDIGSDSEFVLRGSNDINKLRESDKETEIEKKLGEIDFQVLSPAEYVADDIDNENAEDRYKRIHEHCGVIKFTYGDEEQGSVMITGDSDLTAWKEHITDYHRDNLKSDALSASHHGSRTFFKEKEDDEPYTDHIDSIDPEYIVVSAPKQSESKYEHPDSDAIEEYKKHISDKDNIFHLGDSNGKRTSVIVDIFSDGEVEVNPDEELVKQYGFKNDENNKEQKTANVIIPPIKKTQIDSKPFG